MGADNVIVCYGVRYSLGLDGELDDEALVPYETLTDPRLVAARRVGLNYYLGKVTDGGEYFLLVGGIIGTFGAQGSLEREVSDAELAETMRRTKAKLEEAGLEGTSALHVQLEAQY